MVDNGEDLDNDDNGDNGDNGGENGERPEKTGSLFRLVVNR